METLSIFVTPPAVQGGFLLEVLKLTDEQIDVMRSKLIEELKSSNKNGISISKYINKIIYLLVNNSSVISDFIEQINSKEVESKIMWSIYDDLTELYPVFSLRSLLFDQAHDNIPNGFKDMLEDIFSSEYPNFPEDKKVKPKRKKATARKIGSLITKADVEKLERYLKRNLIGQNSAINEVIKHLKVVASGLSNRASFFFLGPTGVGKTQLSRLIGERYGAGIIKINCGEYSKSHEYSKLIGSPPGYIGHSDTSFLGERAKKSSRWVFIFDEIEKADEKLFDVLLNVLDEGTIDDSSGKTLNFKDSLFFFTSNNNLHSRVGQSVMGFGDASHVIQYEEVKEELKDDLKKKFKPEFLNRIDDIILFNSLTKEDVAKIAKIQLKDYPIKVTNELVAKIVEEAYSEEYGAREIARYIKSELAPTIADCILDKEVPIGNQGFYTVSYFDGKFQVIDTEQVNEKLTVEVEKTIKATRPVKSKARPKKI